MDHPLEDRSKRRRWPLGLAPRVLLVLLPPALGLVGCGADREALSAAGAPLHLERHFEDAVVSGELASSTLEPLRWTFDTGETSWRPIDFASGSRTDVAGGDGGMTVSLERIDDPWYTGLVAVELPDLDHDDWGEIVVRARTDDVGFLQPAFNLGQRHVEAWDQTVPFRYLGEGTPLIQDGLEHVYRLRSDRLAPVLPAWEPGEPWRELLLTAWNQGPGEVEILSVEVLPRIEGYREEPAGVRSESRGRRTRQALYSHVPGTISYRLEIPEQGRLDMSLAALQESRPVTFRVTAEEEGGEERALFSERIASSEWQHRSVDLSPVAGRVVTLSLVAEGEPGALASWATPTVSGAAPSGEGRSRPNVIFYVIDGGGADLMSLYGYNRRTTPHLEALATEGVVFEHAYSNSAWTKPSTASFMTSLEQSALGFRTLHDKVPEGVTTMAEHFHRAGYQTAVLTSNPWAGSLSGLERGVDWFRDHDAEDHSTSSVELHREFWEWRESFPAAPYWIHFQTTDVHEPHRPVAPFAGLFVSPERRRWFQESWTRMNEGEDLRQQTKDPRSTLADIYRERLVELGIEPREFFYTQRGLYDETMAHQDHQLGRLVERLKAAGEWEDTLLVIAADHGHPAGSFSRFGRELFDPVPASDEGALLDSYRARVPLVFVWSNGLPAGRRVTERVSMIDVLPTLLDLAGLPAPEVLQGQSLVPLLRGEEGWELRPVVLEQLQPLQGGDQVVGHIEMIDGRWGASLEIWPEEVDPETARPVGNQRAARPHRPGMPRLYLYDVWNDPFATRRVNEQHPELIEVYTRRLAHQWDAHQSLARSFGSGEEVELTPEQLESLRALGYIQ